MQIFKGEPKLNGVPQSEELHFKIAEADFNLSRYAKTKSITERLILKGTSDGDEAANFIEVMVKTKHLDEPILGTSASTVAHSSM